MVKIKTQNTPPRHVFWCVVSSRAGKLLLGLTDKNEICRASFLRKREPIEVVEDWHREWRKTSFTVGRAPKDFMTLPLLMIGTIFQKKAWAETMKIPRGEVASYGDIARRIGAPRSARAVGAACGKNYLAYIVPCHRVVSSTGIGGYGSDGLSVKRDLLKAEGVSLSRFK